MTQEKGKDGLSAREFSDLMGVSPLKGKALLGRLNAAGRLRSEKALRPTIAGDMRPVPVYFLTS
jgi:hypothetical protein